MLSTITQERAARRFHHIATLERELGLNGGELAQALAHVKELKETRAGLLLRLRAAARDEGELPLFDLIGDEG